MLHNSSFEPSLLLHPRCCSTPALTGMQVSGVPRQVCLDKAPPQNVGIGFVVCGVLPPSPLVLLIIIIIMVSKIACSATHQCPTGSYDSSHSRRDASSTNTLQDSHLQTDIIQSD
ncbi:hypothetical protein E2C01_029838 [Portunus trituberculatus]|uniref:Uncharacterized protein n=1 Tax=Portunus trituberculatus TaxID=210409 RepID=A0A5B7EQE8_PORTR|nr:hypothetical protein [Portunus trituberculatus]